MPFGSYDTPKPAPLPTFFQYLKTNSPKGIEKKTKFAVEVIWIPGQFDNVTLQTHAFRYVATPDNALYTDTLEFLQTDYGLHTALEIVITSFKDKTIEVSVNEAKLMEWLPIGKAGYRAKFA